MNTIDEINRERQVNEIFLFFNSTITCGWNEFYMHLILEGSEKKLVPILKGVIRINSFYIKSLRNFQRKKKGWIFVKLKKLDFENILIL